MLLLTMCSVSCASSENGGATSDSAVTATGFTVPPLQVRTFVATSVENDDWPDGTPLTLTLGGAVDRLSIVIHATCNDIGGDVAWNGSRMVVDASPLTAAGCPSTDLAVDDWLLDLLGADPVVVLDGNELSMTATVRGQAASITFVRDA